MMVGANGTNGSTGAQTHRVYRASSSNSTAPTIAASTTLGTIPTNWSSTPVTLTTTNNTQWQSDGVTAVNSTSTIWSTPYLSYFKVAKLSAIAADIGSITAGSINGVSLTVGSVPTISGTTMTGNGGKINSDGTFAFGNATTNIVGDAAGSLYLNGNIISTGNINSNAVTEQGGSSANNSVTAYQDTTLLQGSYVTPTQYGSVSITFSIYVVFNSWNDQVPYPPYDPPYFSLYRCYDSNPANQNSLINFSVPIPGLTYFGSLTIPSIIVSWTAFDKLADNRQVFYQVRGGDLHAAHYYQTRSLVVISTKR